MKRLKEFLAIDDKPRAKSNVAQIASALVALVALIGIYVQVHLGRLNALRASARQVYLSYSQATLQHPRLARPNYQHLKDDPDPTELIRYQTYVTSMLEAYDEILDIVDEPEWVAAFRYDVVDHMPYLCEKNDPKYLETFYKKTRRLVAEEKTKHCSNLAPILKSAPSYLPKH